MRVRACMVRFEVLRFAETWSLWDIVIVGGGSPPCHSPLVVRLGLRWLASAGVGCLLHLTLWYS